MKIKVTPSADARGFHRPPLERGIIEAGHRCSEQPHSGAQDGIRQGVSANPTNRAADKLAKILGQGITATGDLIHLLFR